MAELDRDRDRRALFDFDVLRPRRRLRRLELFGRRPSDDLDRERRRRFRFVLRDRCSSLCWRLTLRRFRRRLLVRIRDRDLDRALEPTLLRRRRGDFDLTFFLILSDSDFRLPTTLEESFFLASTSLLV